jgi:hypothetical protein
MREIVSRVCLIMGEGSERTGCREKELKKMFL